MSLLLRATPWQEGMDGPRASPAGREGGRRQQVLWLLDTVLVKGLHLGLTASFLAFLRATQSRLHNLRPAASLEGGCVDFGWDLQLQLP